MTEEERRRCCILGGCGCQPGGVEQRAALRSWLLKNFAPPEKNEQSAETYVDRRLDELLQGTKSGDGKVIASADGPFVLGDEPLEIDLDLNPDEGD